MCFPMTFFYLWFMFFERIGRWGAACSTLILAYAASCTVKEDRTECPCLLAVAFENLPPGPVEYRLEAMDGNLLARETVTRDSVYFFKVPRDGVRLTAVCGASADDVVIPYGSQCPPVYMFCSAFHTNHEYVQIQPILNKHYCLLNIELDGPPGDGAPVAVGVRGCISGVSLEGRPVEGAFSYKSDGTLSCRLPRQAPSDKLLLDIVMEDNVVRTFALGTYMREAGFDWTEKDLRDAIVSISLSVTHISFQIQDWSYTTDMNVEI